MILQLVESGGQERCESTEVRENNLMSGNRLGIFACMNCSMQIVSSSGAPIGQVSLADSISDDPALPPIG